MTTKPSAHAMKAALNIQNGNRLVLEAVFRKHPNLGLVSNREAALAIDHDAIRPAVAEATKPLVEALEACLRQGIYEGEQFDIEGNIKLNTRQQKRAAEVAAQARAALAPYKQKEAAD